MFQNKRLSLQSGCAVCQGQIYVFIGKTVSHNADYTSVWFGYDDGSNAEVAVCKDCLAKGISLDLAQEIQKDICYSWGRDIIDNPLSIAEVYKQMEWFVSTAIRMRVVKVGKTKAEVCDRPEG